MKMEQIAMAVVNDKTTEQIRAYALAKWIEGLETAAVHAILPAVFAELRKQIYEGVSFEEGAGSWTAARAVLDYEINRAIAERGQQ